MASATIPSLRRLRPACWLALLLALLSALAPARAGVVVIGHASLPRLDDGMVQKIYSGKVIEVGGVNVTAVNLRSGSTARNHFLQTYLVLDEEKYTAYWTVRRYIGKGVPPRELGSGAEVVSFVQTTPGAIGYVDDSDLKPGLNVLLRK
jgi:ABC-type phosphate transport system substrate-binding protein